MSSRSTCSMPSRLAISMGISFAARQRTRSPDLANFSCRPLKLAGTSRSRGRKASQEPFTRASTRSCSVRVAPGLCKWPSPGPWWRTSTDIRCNSDANGNRHRTCSRSAPLPALETTKSGPGMVQRIACSAARSSGSPTTSPSTTVRPLQAAITAVVKNGSCCSSWSVADSSFAGAGGGGAAPPSRPWTPSTSIESRVSVPVLSKQHVSTLPARGTRKGSVQKVLFCTSATRLRFTASESMMGNSGGTTEVMMWLTARKSLNVERAGSPVRVGATTRPSWRT
mmetsp:Transcript_100697/g.285381  ORF Transcript_100697/g.285381 Transcript_100697/m.285381 type:complete len:282 (+) Transcript_100697:1625-2470(+)